MVGARFTVPLLPSGKIVYCSDASRLLHADLHVGFFFYNFSRSHRLGLGLGLDVSSSPLRHGDVRDVSSSAVLLLWWTFSLSRFVASWSLGELWVHVELWGAGGEACSHFTGLVGSRACGGDAVADGGELSPCSRRDGKHEATLTRPGVVRDGGTTVVLLLVRR